MLSIILVGGHAENGLTKWPPFARQPPERGKGHTRRVAQVVGRETRYSNADSRPTHTGRVVVRVHYTMSEESARTNGRR